MSRRTANGRSSIYRGGDGRWHGYVSMGVKNDGRPDRRHVQAATEKFVTAKVRDLERLRDAGTAVTVGKVPTVGAWLQYWLDNVATRKVRPSTLAGYRSKITQHLMPGLGAHRIDQLRPEHLEAFYRACDEAGLSPATVLQLHRILSGALKVAQQRGRVARNVCTLVDAPSAERAEVKPLTAEDARKILASARGRRNAARWSVALALGLRQGEALGMRWEFVDLEAARMRIRWQLQRRPWDHGCGRVCGQRRGADCPQRRLDVRAGEFVLSGGLVLADVKSSAGRRTIALPEQLVDALRAHRDEQNAERQLAGELWHGHDLVFAQPNGQPINPRTDWGAWKELLKDAGARDSRLHDARHTSASLLLAEGVPGRVAMELPGHSSIQLTLGTYSHVAPEVATVAAERIGDALWH